MRIQNIYNNTTFESRNCPIKPFTIPTKKGALFVEELTIKDMKKAAEFQYDCILDLDKKSENPPRMTSFDRLSNLQMFKELYLKTLWIGKRDNTILIIKDKKEAEGKVKGIIFLKNYDRFYKKKGYKTYNLNVGFINDFLIDEQYRNEGVGSILLNEIIKTAKGRFSDILLLARNKKALSFYERNGFKSVDLSAPEIRKLPYYVFGCENDNTKLMEKSLDPSNPWRKRISKYY